MSEAVRVNFGRPMPLFPLDDAVLLPHAVLPLHVFEPRYRQMVDHCLEGSGQFAMARTEPGLEPDDAPLPALRPAVCIGQIMQYHQWPDGRHNLLLQGVCRARITELVEPADERLYRMARLAPLEAVDQEPPPMLLEREELRELLEGPRLRRLRNVKRIIEWFDNDDVTTHALLELLGFALVRDVDARYRLLEEPDPHIRAELIREMLLDLDHLVARAERQPYRSWPKGVSWN